MKPLLLWVSLLAFSPIALAAGINLNAASQTELAALPAIGAVKAKSIVAYRTANGCFKSVSDLLKVQGMTQADVDAISGQVEAGSCPSGGPSKPSKAET
ncbi:MAG: helix-hairpin-helix domain-containing protein [Betaproteobacteria bacterium]